MKINSWLLAILFGLAALTNPSFVNAEHVYKCKDTSGRTTYSQQICPNQEGEKVRVWKNSLPIDPAVTRAIQTKETEGLTPSAGQQACEQLIELSRANIAHMTLGEAFTHKSRVNILKAVCNGSTTSSPNNPAQSCISDVVCGVDKKCMKQPNQYAGMCMNAVDRYGAPSVRVPSVDISSGRAQCVANTDCPIGFQCNLQYRACMK